MCTKSAGRLDAADRRRIAPHGCLLHFLPQSLCSQSPSVFLCLVVCFCAVLLFFGSSCVSGVCARHAVLVHFLSIESRCFASSSRVQGQSDLNSQTLLLLSVIPFSRMKVPDETRTHVIACSPSRPLVHIHPAPEHHNLIPLPESHYSSVQPIPSHRIFHSVSFLTIFASSRQSRSTKVQHVVATLTMLALGGSFPPRVVTTF